jgi:class 3 adenylate cyclase
MRRLSPLIECRGRLYPQLGVAAAAAFFGLVGADGLTARDVAIESGAARVGRTRLPIRDGRTLVAWPQLRRSTGLADLWDAIRGRNAALGAFGLLAQEPNDPPTVGHVPIGVIAELPDAERRLASQRADWEKLAQALLRDVVGQPPEDLDDPAKRPAVLASLREQAQFVLAEAPKVPEAGEDPQITGFRNWSALDRNLTLGEAEIEKTRARLREAIAGKLAFVGWTTSGDVYPTAADALTPGVVVNASFASQTLTGNVVSEAAPALGALVAFLLGSLGAAAAGLGRVGPRAGLLVLALLALAYALVNALLVFETGHVHLALAIPLLALAAGWAAATVSRQVSLLREKARLFRQFGARVHKRLFEYLLQHPDVVDVKGVEREVTVLFSDLAGFTSVSESLDSTQTVALLNRYMGAMNEVLTEHDAYVNKFLGDGIMACWGAFGDDPDRGKKACRAALACFERLERLKHEVPGGSVERLSMRIGLATGVVTVGDCGAPPDFSDYTVIGDSVNLASRLESANKQFGTRIAIDGRTRELAGDEIVVRPIGAFVVVGQSRATEMYEVVAAARGGAPPAEIAGDVARATRAVELYRAGRLEESRVAWLEIVDASGPSKLATIYLEEIDDWLERPSREFDGTIALKAK